MQNRPDQVKLDKATLEKINKNQKLFKVFKDYVGDKVNSSDMSSASESFSSQTQSNTGKSTSNLSDMFKWSLRRSTQSKSILYCCFHTFRRQSLDIDEQIPTSNNFTLRFESSIKKSPKLGHAPLMTYLGHNNKMSNQLN